MEAWHGKPMLCQGLVVLVSRGVVLRCDDTLHSQMVDSAFATVNNGFLEVVVERRTWSIWLAEDPDLVFDTIDFVAGVCRQVLGQVISENLFQVLVLPVGQDERGAGY